MRKPTNPRPRGTTSTTPGDATAPADTGAPGRLSQQELRAWVEASCAQQGVPVKVTDPAVIASVSVLLTGRQAPP